MASTTITTHGVASIKAMSRSHAQGDFMRLTLVDRNGDELEIELYAKSDFSRFEAIAEAINAAAADRHTQLQAAE